MLIPSLLSKAASKARALRGSKSRRLHERAASRGAVLAVHVGVLPLDRERAVVAER